MNPYTSQASYIPFIPMYATPQEPPIPPYGYGSAYPASHWQSRRQDTQRNDHAGPYYPPLPTPTYPSGPDPHPVGYLGPFTPNYAMWSAPPATPTSYPSAFYHQSDPYFLPPQRRQTPHLPHPPGPTNGQPLNDAHQRTRPSTPIAPPSRSGTPFPRPPSPTRTTGRYGINELLNCQLDSHPYIDWVIYNDLSFARQWAISKSGIERCQSISFDSLAVVPPVNKLCIRAEARGRYAPLGQAIQRWGDIRVCRFDRFLCVGDVLHEIWAYFYAVLTEAEKTSMPPPFSRRVEECFHKRWNARGRLLEQVVKRRCDALLDCVRFAGLQIDPNFEDNRVLYLSLEDVNLR